MQLAYFKSLSYWNSFASFLTKQLHSEHADLFKSLSLTIYVSFTTLLTKYIEKHFRFSMFT